MSIFCSFNNVIGYTTRSDWNHHRNEILGSLMNGDGTSEAIILYTLFHWESLFVVAAQPTNVNIRYEYFDESFQALLDYGNWPVSTSTSSSSSSTSKSEPEEEGRKR